MEYDPTALEVLKDPFPVYAHLRQNCPVHRFDGFGTPLYSVADRDEVHRMLVDGTTWSNRHGPGVRYDDQNPGSLARCDPPEHGIRRRFVSEAFPGPGEVESTDEITERADRIVDRIARHGSAELHDEYAARLPVISVPTVLGRPETDCEEIAHHVAALTGRMGQPHDADDEWSQLHARCLQLVEERRTVVGTASLEPGTDPLAGAVPPGLLSHLCCHPMEDGRYLTDDEAAGLIAMLLVAGGEPTALLITNAVWRLLQDRGRWETLVDQPELVPNVVEESLRFDPPVLGNCRTNTAAVEMGGAHLAPGSKVMYLVGAANRSPDVVDGPDEFRVDRPLNESRRHYSFGAGPHFCLGAAVARRTAQAALLVLVERLPSLRLDGTARRVNQPFLWGRRVLPVAWD